MLKGSFLHSRPRGISIIEILIAYAVLTVAVLALLGCLPLAASQQQNTITDTQAMYFAEQKMDELLLEDVAISEVTKTDYPLGDNSMVRTWWGEYGNNVSLQTVTVQVTWTGAHSGRNVTLRSCIFK